MAEDRARVLVVEDNPTQIQLYKKILQAGSYEVSMIADPQDLLRGLESAMLPDVMLLDILLPGIEGIAVLEELERHPQWCLVPAVMMTSSPTQDRVLAARKLPVPPEGFLVKPVDPMAMLQLLRAVIDAKEPMYLSRKLQRQRLGLQISLREDVLEIEAALRESNQSPRSLNERIARTRREMQSLRLMQGRLHDSPPETRNALNEKLKALEGEIVDQRREVHRAESRRKRILQLRQDITMKQRSIKELERQIQILAPVIKAKAKPGEAVHGVEVPAGVEAQAALPDDLDARIDKALPPAADLDGFDLDLDSGSADDPLTGTDA